MKNLAKKWNFPAGILTGSWQEKNLGRDLGKNPGKSFGSRHDLAKTTVIPPRQP